MERKVKLNARAINKWTNELNRHFSNEEVQMSPGRK
jgi:hypothetical protein